MSCLSGSDREKHLWYDPLELNKIYILFHKKTFIEKLPDSEAVSQFLEREFVILRLKPQNDISTQTLYRTIQGKEIFSGSMALLQWRKDVIFEECSKRNLAAITRS